MVVGRLIALTLVGVAAGCFDAGSFMCGEPAECRYSDVQGRCEANGFCSYPSSDCPSGRLWGPYAGDGLAGACVEPDGAGDAGEGSADAVCEGWPAGWRHRRALRFNLDQHFAGSPGFPALVVLDPSRIDYAATAAGGRDVHFTDGAGNPLPRDIEAWVEDGTSHVWVRVPQLGPDVGLVYIYYGNEGGDEVDDPTVFDADFAAVWHLGGDRSDASGRGRDLLDDPTLATAGVAGPASEFHVVDEEGPRITAASTSAALGDPFAGTTTVTAWIHAARDPDEFAAGTVFSVADGPHGIAGLAGFVGDGTESNALCFGREFGGITTSCTPEDSLAGADWHHVAWISEPATRTTTMFIDGDQQATTLDGVASEPATGVAELPVYLGDDAIGARPLAGAIDEFRIATTRREAEWIRAEYLSGTDALFEYGDEQTCP